ncbi:HI0074 family nucleotidyltransferase substrate-binding subunit [Candidatus Agathobaculum pullicola]|uniref:HI0074 family nucleotidyltransferase substrate-binding subunit n=1 Tax=Candidatus Agathobaculum pullicola TaxID=2838426 RepID=UPI003F9357E0
MVLERDNKRENYCKAVACLHEALKEYGGHSSETMRDGVIQWFEFATELAWKACREYLSDLGYAEVNGPKTVMREAFAHGMVADGEAWIRILTDRNLTSRVYKNRRPTKFLIISGRNIWSSSTRWYDIFVTCK